MTTQIVRAVDGGGLARPDIMMVEATRPDELVLLSPESLVRQA